MQIETLAQISNLLQLIRDRQTTTGVDFREADRLICALEAEITAQQEFAGPEQIEEAATGDALGVHAAHCCAEHGCKYGKDDCPVVAGRVKQDGPCEVCDESEEWQAAAEADQLRDTFAAAALTGLLLHGSGGKLELNEHVNRGRRERLAAEAWQTADAMLKARRL